MDDFGRIITTVFLDRPDPGLLAAEIEDSISDGADRVEIRIDAFKSPFDHAALINLAGRYPILFSGNRFSLSEAERAFLEKASRAGAWIDIPYEENFKAPKAVNPAKLIISFHGEITGFEMFERTIWKLEGVSALIKIVPQVKDILEAAVFLSWSNELARSHDLITFPSGAESAFARILALSSGSRAVYCGSQNSESAVPGQMKLKELAEFDPAAITGKTALYGLTGTPLNYTKSPALWNRWFSELSMDARFLPFPASVLEDALKAFSILGVKGFGVTAPYKERILPHVDSCSNTAARCGAANTVKVENNELRASNTDVFGVRRALSFLKKGRRILVLGSGGASRAAVFALRNSHNVAVSARSGEKGAKLADALGIAHIGWEHKHSYEYDLIINSTLPGSNGNSMPWGEREPVRSSYLMDMVVSAEETPFEKKASEEGVALIRGDAMLYYQAALQFRILTGKKPPGELLRCGQCLPLI
jgi:3-dehydroquinate dehydratase / shikimate dehydrogenase